MVFLSSSKLRNDSDATCGFPQRSVSSSTSSSNLIQRAVSFHCSSWFLSIVSSFSSTNTLKQEDGVSDIRYKISTPSTKTCTFWMCHTYEPKHKRLLWQWWLLWGMSENIKWFTEIHSTHKNIVHVFTVDVQLGEQKLSKHFKDPVLRQSEEKP